MGDIINRCHDNNYLYTYALFHTDGNWLTCKIPLRKDKSFQCAGGFISMFVHFLVCVAVFSLQWRHNGRDSVSNHQPHDCLLNCLFRRRWKKHQSSAWLAFVWWIPRRNGQSRGKCFHLMTSLWVWSASIGSWVSWMLDLVHYCISSKKHTIDIERRAW